MKETKFETIITECSRCLNKEQSNKIFNIPNEFKELVYFLDYINISVYDLKMNDEISNYCYEEILKILDNYYQKGISYSVNRIDWLKDLLHYEGNIKLENHHKQLLVYFNQLNNILNYNNIDYFHASGFLCCLLIGKKLERYHHDIDLYVNIDDIDKFKNIFDNDKFKLIHTCEKNDEKILRHGYKIVSSIYNIPIWLSFYRQLNDGTIYIQEYFQDLNGTCFTKENYNSPLCCKLSLVKQLYNDIPFNSLSLEALYLSKRDNRKKDVFDCKLMEKFVNYNNLKELEKELCTSWNIIEGFPEKIQKAFFCLDVEDKKNAKAITKKRI